jgi:hypothetical protein
VTDFAKGEYPAKAGAKGAKTALKKATSASLSLRSSRNQEKDCATHARTTPASPESSFSGWFCDWKRGARSGATRCEDKGVWLECALYVTESIDSIARMLHDLASSAPTVESEVESPLEAEEANLWACAAVERCRTIETIGAVHW